MSDSMTFRLDADVERWVRDEAERRGVTMTDVVEGSIREAAAGVGERPPIVPSRTLLGERFAERIAGGVIAGLFPSEPDADRRAAIGKLVAGVAEELLGEVPLSTLVRSKIAEAGATLDRPGSPENVKAAAEAIAALAQAGNVLQLGERAQAEHRAVLDRVAELEGELAARPPMPAGAYYFEVRLEAGGTTDEPSTIVHVEVGAQGRKVAGGTVSRADREHAIREAVALGGNAIADDVALRP